MRVEALFPETLSLCQHSSCGMRNDNQHFKENVLIFTSEFIAPLIVCH